MSTVTYPAPNGAGSYYLLDSCRICGFDAPLVSEGSEESEDNQFCQMCGFCLLRPVAPKRAPPKRPEAAGGTAATSSATASPITSTTASPSSSPPVSARRAAGTGAPPPPKRAPPPKPLAQIADVLKAFEAGGGGKMDLHGLHVALRSENEEYDKVVRGLAPTANKSSVPAPISVIPAAGSTSTGSAPIASPTLLADIARVEREAREALALKLSRDDEQRWKATHRRMSQSMEAEKKDIAKGLEEDKIKRKALEAEIETRTSEEEHNKHLAAIKQLEQKRATEEAAARAQAVAQAEQERLAAAAEAERTRKEMEARAEEEAAKAAKLILQAQAEQAKLEAALKQQAEKERQEVELQKQQQKQQREAADRAAAEAEAAIKKQQQLESLKRVEEERLQAENRERERVRRAAEEAAELQRKQLLEKAEQEKRAAAEKLAADNAAAVALAEQKRKQEQEEQNRKAQEALRLEQEFRRKAEAAEAEDKAKAQAEEKQRAAAAAATAAKEAEEKEKARLQAVEREKEQQRLKQQAAAAAASVVPQPATTTVPASSVTVASPAAPSTSSTPSSGSSSSSSTSAVSSSSGTSSLLSRFASAQAASHESIDLKVQERLNNAVRWVDKEIRKLIAAILELRSAGKGSVNAAQQAVVKYGDLFQNTQNSMEALSGTLMTAKKRGVVAYAGALLFQGKDDPVEITLLKTEIPDTPLPDHSARKQAPMKPSAFAATQVGAVEKCTVCQKTVYPAERVGAASKVYHQECFRCTTCNKILDAHHFCNVNAKNYCKACYDKLVHTAEFHASK